MNIQYLKAAVAALVVSFFVAGCATEKAPAVPQLAFEPTKTLTATGYGTVEKTDRYSRSQIKLMAMRASKMDAYRSLAEQLNGIQLRGHTTVENMQITHDSYNVYLNSYLRGARVKRTLAIGTDIYAGDDTFETVVELDLTPEFYQCMNGSPEQVNQCAQQIQPSPAAGFDQNPPAVSSIGSGCNAIDCYSYPSTKGFSQR